MVNRESWLKRIEAAWRRRSLVWLQGVRRAGKTSLCHTLPDVDYFDCELPRTREAMADPEAFLERLRGRRVVLDEVHRLGNPSELLKIAADHFPDVRIVATGSSTLGASRKFRDTLTGRKETVWLTPMTSEDLQDFGAGDLRHRLLRGGLPPFFLADPPVEHEFQEWMDDYWAKDVDRLFRLERRHAFERLAELLMAQSSGIFEATRLARDCEVSRATVMNYLAVLEATRVMHVIRPFSGRSRDEIVAAPKVYAFDTGFVCTHRGWDSLRTDDLGILWEHFILNELHAQLQTPCLHYWRDKRGHEGDFVLAERGRPPTTIECKWSASRFDSGPLRAFRARHPKGANLVVAQDVERPFERKEGKLLLRYVGIRSLAEALPR